MATPKKKTTSSTKKSTAKSSSKTAAKKPPTKKIVAKKTTEKKVAPKSKNVKKAEPKKATTKKVETKKASTSTSKTAKSATKKEGKAPVKVAKKPDVCRCPISGIPVKAEKPNISPKTLKKLEELLLEEREKHIAQSDELEAEAVELIADREAGDTQFDEESGEGDSVAVERERTLFLSAEALNTVAQIDRALQRIKDGTYGVCVPSGRRIAVARLEALPWTEVCVDCKARSERRR